MATGITQDEFFDAIARGDMAMVTDVLQNRPGAAGWGMEISAGMRLAGGGLRMPLHHAALFGQLEAARALVAAGAELDLRDKSLDTPLMIAAAGQREDIALLLLEAGADPNITGGIDQTPLMAAAGKAAYALVEKLAAAGADMNAVAGNDTTALHWAAEKKDRKMMRLLIDLGIDASIKNAAGFTAAGQDASLQAFIDGCLGRRAERQAFIQNQIDMVKNGSDAPVIVRRPLSLTRKPS